MIMADDLEDILKNFDSKSSPTSSLRQTREEVSLLPDDLPSSTTPPLESSYPLWEIVIIRGNLNILEYYNVAPSLLSISALILNRIIIIFVL